jgi:iron complex outermembrane receptor protein
MTRVKIILLAGAAIAASTFSQMAAAHTAAPEAETVSQGEIVVTGLFKTPTAGTKTATPLIETPQPISIITEDMFRAQGAINISDTVRYTAGVTANAYGRDTRVDSFVIRGIDALQFRDGMRDIFSYYASITSDPYNFSRVEVVRGPASVLFGQGSIGGLINLVSKTPDFETRGEVSATYGSYNRKEVMADVNGPLSGNLAVRLVVRLRDADTEIAHVPDNRVMIAPSIRWQPTPDTDITVLGLYQDDHSGSTTQFLPIVGTLLDNPGNPRLPRDFFVGKPGWDRYDGRSLQVTGIVSHKLSDAIQVNLKARYIDSDLTYFTHYTDSYSNPTNPYIAGSNGRQIGLYSDGSIAGTNVFSTDNNIQFKFDTGSQVKHLLLAGLDYSWNKVKKRGGFGYEVIDIYNIDYNALQIPAIDPNFAYQSQKQLGIYVQDQIRFWDRVSVVLGVRRDHVRTAGSPATTDNATTFRAGIIGEIGAGFSPFFSYTESFQPIAGATSAGTPFKPQSGTQYEIGVKWQPDPSTLVTVTGFQIRESNRPIADPANPLGQIQAGKLTTKGFEIEALRTLSGNFDLSVNYGYNNLKSKDSPYFDMMPKHNASVWSTKTVRVGEDTSLRLGAGVRYTGKRTSIGPVWTIDTKSNTLVDALAEVEWSKWRLSINATNLFNKKFFASCLSRGDCFIGAERNVMGTVAYKF